MAIRAEQSYADEICELGIGGDELCFVVVGGGINERARYGRTCLYAHTRGQDGKLWWRTDRAIEDSGSPRWSGSDRRQVRA